MRREQRGTMLPTVVQKSAVELGYRGLDQVVRRTRLSFSPAPLELSETSAVFQIEVPAHESKEFSFAVACNPGAASEQLTFEQAELEAAADISVLRAHDATIQVSNELFNDWLDRSALTSVACVAAR